MRLWTRQMFRRQAVTPRFGVYVQTADDEFTQVGVLQTPSVRLVAPWERLGSHSPAAHTVGVQCMWGRYAPSCQLFGSVKTESRWRPCIGAFSVQGVRWEMQTTDRFGRWRDVGYLRFGPIGACVQGKVWYHPDRSSTRASCGTDKGVVRFHPVDVTLPPGLATRWSPHPRRRQ